MTWGAWLFLKDFSMTLSGGVDTHSKIVCLLGVVELEVVDTIVVEGMMRGLEHPQRGVV